MELAAATGQVQIKQEPVIVPTYYSIAVGDVWIEPEGSDGGEVAHRLSFYFGGDGNPLYFVDPQLDSPVAEDACPYVRDELFFRIKLLPVQEVLGRKDFEQICERLLPQRDDAWVASIRHDWRQQQNLGYFVEEQAAARAFDKAARELRGDEAHGGRAGPKGWRLTVP
eukprot:COSAG04_NODE_11618_length_698_cov_1.380634_1_plen_167_part_10